MRIKAAVLLLMSILSLPVFAGKRVVSDDEIFDLVRRRLASDQVVKGGRLEVEVKQGIVTLRGNVEQDKQRSRAERLAKKVSGVKGVTNEIRVARTK